MRIKRHHLITATLGLLAVILGLIAQPAFATVPGDDFIRGYIASVLEQGLGWNRSDYRIEVADGHAAITMLENDPASRDAALEKLRSIEELKEVAITVTLPERQETGKLREIAEKIAAGEKLPAGDVFRPLVADPKLPQFFVSLDHIKTPRESYTMGEAGFGETFGLYKFRSGRKGESLQLSVGASLIARFNMETDSYNLLNADYTVGLPLTYRRGDNSFRLRLYHQSSHLGDEFLLLNPDHPERINLSFEALEFIYSREWEGFRAYVGGEYMIRRDPSDLERTSAHFGFDYIGSKKFFHRGRFIGGVDVKSYDELAWNLDTSVKFGILFGSPDSGHRRLRLLAEWYRGHDPRGQCFVNRVTYYGLNLSLGF